MYLLNVNTVEQKQHWTKESWMEKHLSEKRSKFENPRNIFHNNNLEEVGDMFSDI
jgi:hypothetical protein